MERSPTFWELAVQATTSTRQGYNLLAPRFEKTPYATPAWIIKVCLERVEQLHGPLEREGARGLDLGCGTGRASLALAESCQRVDGIDFSPLMLAEAKSKTAHLENTIFDFQEKDMATLELPAAAYDRIVTFGAWGHILVPWRQRLVAECVKALKPGGVFATVTADPASVLSRRWWYSLAFDTGLRLRNAILAEPFHMYYRLNATPQVRDLFARVGEVEVRLEPIPRKPHRELTLLMARRNLKDS